MFQSRFRHRFKSCSNKPTSGLIQGLQQQQEKKLQMEAINQLLKVRFY